MQKHLKRPMISVILTSYNHERFLRESIESVLRQTYRDFELIIVDDCSTDGSWDIICAYQDERIRKVRHAYNYGSSVLQDAVQRHARGKYVAVHHSDDAWLPDKLQKQMDFLRQHKEYKVVFTNAQAVDEEGEPYEDEDGFYSHAFHAQNRGRHEWLRHFLQKGNCLCHPSVLLERKVYRRAKPFATGLKQVPDLLIWIRICKKYDIYILPEKLVRFRIQNAEKNTSGRRTETQIRSGIESMLLLEEYASIRKRSDFEKIFPEVRLKGSRNRDIRACFAKFCLHEKMPGYAQLFAIQEVYAQLQTKKGKKLLEGRYQLDVRQFIAYTGKYDVFGLVRPYSDQTATLYAAYGDDQWEELAKRQYYLDATKHLAFSYDVSMLGDGVMALRFDPCEYLYIRASAICCRIDGQDLHPRIFGQGEAQEEGFFFTSKDPILLMDWVRGRLLEIEMTVERV